MPFFAQHLYPSESYVRTLRCFSIKRGVPLGKAASLIPVDRLAFRHLLASRKVPVSYSSMDLDDDLRTLADMLPEQPCSDPT